MDQRLIVQLFGLEVTQETRNTRVDLVRDFDPAAGRWLNSYTLTLTCHGEPLVAQDLEFWYVERDAPGYDSHGANDLEEGMKMGGTLVRLQTGRDGAAHVVLPHLDGIRSIHHSTQLVARFNADRKDPRYKPAQTPQFEFYSRSAHPVPLPEGP